MAECYGYTCDICGNFVSNFNGIFRVKVRSGHFVHYIINDRYSPDHKKFDICENCVREFEKWVKHRILNEYE